jgi:hypothetical protein
MNRVAELRGEGTRVLPFGTFCKQIFGGQ